MFGFVFGILKDLFRFLFLELAKHYCYNLLRHYFRDAHLPKLGLKRGASIPKRSSRWPTVEKHYREQHPTCAACGSKTRLQIHHVKPFHIHPELELDPNNLISLCMSFRKECHLKLGHLDNFSHWNERVREDAAYVRANPDEFNRIVKEAKLRWKEP